MKTTDIDTKRKKAGERLKECMNIRNISSVELINQLAPEQKIDPAFLSQMRSGKRSITFDNAILFAKYLDVHSGYLLGDDDFTSSSYKEYIQHRDAKKAIPFHKEKWDYYNRYLKPVGARITNTIISDDSNNGFVRVQFGKESADISFKDMEEFHADIESYIKKALAHMIQKHKYDSITL